LRTELDLFARLYRDTWSTEHKKGIMNTWRSERRRQWFVSEQQSPLWDKYIRNHSKPQLKHSSVLAKKEQPLLTNVILVL